MASALSEKPELTGAVRATQYPGLRVALLTGGGDRHYAFGMATALTAQGLHVDFIGGDEVDSRDLHTDSLLTFWNLRVSGAGVTLLQKIARVLSYYSKLIRYANNSRAQVFHILWNNKFEGFDRTLLMLYYRALGKKVVLTAHNVNAGVRDGDDSWWNRFTLKLQYRLSDQVFVHTEKMRADLQAQFGLPLSAITTIPYGINNAIPTTGLSSAEARQRLGIAPRERAVLFFGNIAPYKGLEYLVEAVKHLLRSGGEYRLIVAGRPKKGCDSYVNAIRGALKDDVFRARVIMRMELIPDEDVELYFKAADLSVLPYTHIFQSGVLFLTYSFGLPAIVSDVGCLADDVEEGNTGYVVSPHDSAQLASAIERYFVSDMYRCLDERRELVKNFIEARHSWTTVGQVTRSNYERLLCPSI